VHLRRRCRRGHTQAQGDESRPGLGAAGVLIRRRKAARLCAVVPCGNDRPERQEFRGRRRMTAP
jgi:hypothetical protein